MIWSKAIIWGWCILWVLVGVYELWTLFDKNPHTPPLTNLVVRYVPWWVTMPVLVWLVVHFSIRYANPKYIAALKAFGTARIWG